MPLIFYNILNYVILFISKCRLLKLQYYQTYFSIQTNMYFTRNHSRHPLVSLNDEQPLKDFHKLGNEKLECAVNLVRNCLSRNIPFFQAYTFATKAFLSTSHNVMKWVTAYSILRLISKLFTLILI